MRAEHLRDWLAPIMRMTSSPRLKLLMGIASLGVAIVAIVWACERLFPDSYEATFSSYEEALRQNAVSPLIPRSAVDIRMVSTRESSERWLSFRAPTPDIATMVRSRSCTRIAESAVEYPRDTPYAPKDWPTALTRGGRRGDRRYEYYRCYPLAGDFTAVDPQHGEVFEWRL